MKQLEYSRDYPDDVLVAFALDGEQAAFETLVLRYSTHLLHFINAIVSDRELAYDILQHVFIKLYLSLPRLREYKRLKPWLFRVAHNACIDHLRMKRTIAFSTLETLSSGNDPDDPPDIEMIPDPDPLPEEQAEYSDLQAQLQHAIHTLPPKFCTVVLLHSMRQLTFTEIGQELHIPRATAKTYFQRAKRLLRARLGESMSPVAAY